MAYLGQKSAYPGRVRRSDFDKVTVSQGQIPGVGLYPAQSASHTVFKVGTKYYYRNGLTGATGSGNTNAATVIQAAFNGLTAGRTHKEKVVLKGDITLSSIVNLPSYTLLEIQGKIKLADSINPVAILRANSKTAVEICGGAIDGNGAAQTSGRIILIDGDSSDFSVHNMYLHDAYDDAIYINSALATVTDYGMVYGIHGYNNASCNVRIGYSRHVVVSGNVFHGTGEGVHVDYASSDNIIANNDIYCSGNYGIAIWGSNGACPNNLVASNNIQGSAADGIIVNDSSDFCTITGNRIRSTTADGMALDSVSKCVVSNNILQTLGGYGIFILDSNRNMIECNWIDDATTDGICVNDWYNVTRGNTIHSSGRDGIRINNVTGGSASSNFLEANVGYGIKMMGTSDYLSILSNVLTANGTGTIDIVGLNNTIRSNSGFNPYGVITNPFTEASSVVGLPVGATASPTASKDYVVIGCDVNVVTSDSGNSDATITLKDSGGNTWLTDASPANTKAYHLCVGEKINWGAFTGAVPTVVVCGL